MKKIVLTNQKESVACNISEIVAITCRGDCTTVHFKDCKKTFSQSKSLNYFEELLSPTPYNYLRISKKALVSLDAVWSVNKSNRNVELLCGRSYEVSVRKLKILIKALESLN